MNTTTLPSGDWESSFCVCDRTPRPVSSQTIANTGVPFFLRLPRLAVFSLSLLMLVVSARAVGDEYEKGQTIGRLGTAAVMLDHFDRTCSDVHYSAYMGVAEQLLRAQWGRSFLELAEALKSEGQDIIQTSVDLVQTAIDNFGGCKTERITYYIMGIRETYFRDINKVRNNNH